LDLHYKIHEDSDQVAKFQGDRSREFGERVAKKKKNITGKTEDSSTVARCMGGLIKHEIKLITSPASLAQLLQPSLAFCFS